MKILTLILLQNLISKLSNACLDITVKDSCDDVFSMQVIEEACVRYTGGALGFHGCTLEFTNSDRRSSQICIKPDTLQLSCSTEVKYYNFVASDFFGAERKFTCGQISYDEWCEESSSVFIKIKSSSESDKVTLQVYLETRIPEEVLIAIIIPSVFVTLVFIICVTILCCKRHHRNVQVSAGPRNVTVLTSAGYYQPGLSGNQRTRVGSYQSYPVGVHAPPRPGHQQTSQGHEYTNMQPVSNMNTSPKQLCNPVVFHTSVHTSPHQLGNQQSYGAGSQLHPMHSTNQMHTSPRHSPVPSPVPGSRMNSPAAGHQSPTLGPRNKTVHTSAGYNQPGLSGNQRTRVGSYHPYPVGVHAPPWSGHQQTSQTHEYIPMQPVSNMNTSPQKISNSMQSPAIFDTSVHTPSRQSGNQQSYQAGSQLHPMQATHQVHTSPRHSPVPSPVSGSRINSRAAGHQSPALDSSEYQPRMSPSRPPPPSYEAAIGSTYHERMEAYKSERDNK